MQIDWPVFFKLSLILITIFLVVGWGYIMHFMAGVNPIAISGAVILLIFAGIALILEWGKI